MKNLEKIVEEKNKELNEKDILMVQKDEKINNLEEENNNLLKTIENKTNEIEKIKKLMNENEKIMNDEKECQSYYLKYFKIRNFDSVWNQGVKSMGIEIGNVGWLSNEWIEYQPYPLNNIVDKNKLETYEISINDKLIINNLNKKYKF